MSFDDHRVHPASREAVVSRMHASAMRSPGDQPEACPPDAITTSVRFADVRCAYSTRRVALPHRLTLLRDTVRPRPGDLVLAQVNSVGHHTRLESPEGRRVQLYRGDEILVSYGNRYAPDQFEAEVPDDLGDCHLVASGGIAARLLSKNARSRNPTRIRPVGLLADLQGVPLNLCDWQIDSRSIPKPLPPVLVVAGTAMNAGKTTAAARLIRGLVRAGKRVGAAKVTGTGAGGDYWQMKDAGASEVVDFIDAGRHLVAEQYADPERLFAMGGSAGGLLMGAVVNMEPTLFKGVIASVPFVDVITTMLDESIPLTTSEYGEWGNPNDKEYYDYMLSYSPYDNVEAKDYPHLLVTAGLHDSQVQYWEPAKWVAKLRAMKTGDNLLLLKTNMEAGHSGATGRFKRHRETAFEYAFLLDLAGIQEVTTTAH